MPQVRFHWNKAFFLFLALATLAAACKKPPPEEELPAPEKPKLVIAFRMVNGQQEVALDEDYTDMHGQLVRPTLLKFYVSDMEVTRGTSATALSEIELVDFEPYDPAIGNPQWDNIFEYELDGGTFDGFRFSLGVKSSLNHSEPTHHANEHPLSVYAGTYWTWATMYRFILFEARASASGNANEMKPLAYHTGLDSLFRPGLDYEAAVDLDHRSRDTVWVDIDLARLFDPQAGIDIASDTNTHTVDSEAEFLLAERFTDRFIEALRVQ